MKKSAQILILILISGIAVLSIIPGCDELVTNEYYDTVYNYDSTIIYYNSENCVGLCHSTTNLLSTTVEVTQLQWAYSGHADNSYIKDQLYGDVANVCGPQCHSREGFIESIDDSASYNTNIFPIDCKGCHNYHDSSLFDFSTRVEEAVDMPSGLSYDFGNSNICAACHQSWYQVDLLVKDSTVIDTTWIQWVLHGANEADVFGGRNGYQVEGGSYDLAQHRNNSEGCISCHMTDSDDLALGGHSMNITGDGVNNLENTCNIPCHGAGTYTPTVLNAIKLTINLKLNQLKDSLISNGLLDPVSEEPIAGQVIADADAAGALYNYFYVLKDKSNGIHNFTYDTTLIYNSILYFDTPTEP